MVTYIAYISINDTDGRSMNFTTAPTVTVWNGRTKAAITTPSPTLTNITTGLYSVDIELDIKTDVLFKIVPDEDDEEDIQDIKVIHEGYIETIGELQSSINAIPSSLLNTVIVGTYTVEQVLKILAAIEVGTVTGGGGTTFVYTGKDGTKVTLSGVDENGNRSVVNVEF